jgi:hypothetical protein
MTFSPVGFSILTDTLRHACSRVGSPLLVGLLVAGCGSSPTPGLKGIALTPAGPSLAKGAAIQLVATGQFVDGSSSNVTSGATWASATPGVATVSSGGLVTGVSTGTSELTATVEQVTGRITVTVGPAVAVAVEVTPAPVTIALGLTAAFQALEYVMSDGTRTPVTGAITWSSQTESVATVDASGLARSRGQGTTSIRATQGSLSGSAPLTVGPPAPASVAVSPASATVFPGRPQRFAAEVTMTDGTSRDVTATAVWSSSDPAVVRMAGALAWSEVRGSAVIRASLGSLSGTATMQTYQSRIAFTTFSHGNGNMASWAYGGGRTGLQAADAICQSSARAGRLPGTYRAFLSDAQDDAYCRMHGLSGKLAAKCGQPALPVTAGPWMRTDGLPYAARIDGMANGETYNPLAFDEYGSLSNLWPAFTGSEYTGAPEPFGNYSDCSGWTSSTAAGIAQGGYASMTSFALGLGGLSCDQDGALACFEVADGEGPALPPRNAIGQLAFMTSLKGPGVLAAWADAGSATGIAAGDAVCGARAAAAGFANPGRFKAWLSDATTNAADRITSNGPWVRPDGVLVATDKAMLVGGTLASSISMTETGRYVNWIPGVSVAWEWSIYAWTGTGQAGLSAADHCQSWTVAAGSVGAAGATDDTSNWSHLVGMLPFACTRPLALYCLED